jgi:hypothetical protein
MARMGPTLQTYTPKPYHREPDETVQCPNGHWNSDDARYCDQGGVALTGKRLLVQKTA